MEPEDDFEPRPLDRHEAELVRRDIDDLAAFRQAFEADGYKGVSLYCEDCDEPHYYGWDMLEGNLRSLLESGDYPVHEPPYDPRPEEYVNWEYAQGFVDGLTESGMLMGPVSPMPDDRCLRCGGELPQPIDDVVYCPTCGMHTGAARIAGALRERGWTADDIAQLLTSAYFPPGTPSGS